MECKTLMVSNQNTLSHCHCGHFSTSPPLTSCSPISCSLLIPWESSHICPFLVNLTIPQYPVCCLGSQFSFLVVHSNLTDDSKGPRLLQQAQSIYCYWIQSFSLGAEKIFVSCRLKWFLPLYYLYPDTFRDKKKKFKASPTRSYPVGTS